MNQIVRLCGWLHAAWQRSDRPPLISHERLDRHFTLDLAAWINCLSNRSPWLDLSIADNGQTEIARKGQSPLINVTLGEHENKRYYLDLQKPEKAPLRPMPMDIMKGRPTSWHLQRAIVSESPGIVSLISLHTFKLQSCTVSSARAQLLLRSHAWEFALYSSPSATSLISNWCQSVQWPGE